MLGSRNLTQYKGRIKEMRVTRLKFKDVEAALRFHVKVEYILLSLNFLG